jgi:hypothetical protein
MAIGKGSESSKKVLKRQTELLRLLEPHKEKMLMIDSPAGSGFHPLTPAIRNHWELIPFPFPKLPEIEEEKPDGKKKGKRKKNIADEPTPEATAEQPAEEAAEEE